MLDRRRLMDAGEILFVNPDKGRIGEGSYRQGPLSATC